MGSSGPIHIEMDNMTVLKDKNILRGNVFVKRGVLEARSEELDVYLKGSKDVEKLIFKGNVRINKEDMRAISDRAEFYVTEDRAVLSGSVRVWQGINYLEGETVTINNKTGEAKVFRGKDKRVKIILNPEEGK
ncbi:LptA/OstA family protein [Geovibrio thiophilus]|nr:LptA/OstA family protein [Geovibrio thiophilus]